MISRRGRRGAGILPLIIILILCICALGVGLLFFTKMFGGGIELGNAVDAGVLNVAKEAIREPSVDVNSLDLRGFDGLGIESAEKIDLGTYNRAVGLTVLVAINAEEEGTGDAKNNAKKQVDKLEKLGQELIKKLKSSEKLIEDFNRVAGANSVRMLGRESTVSGTGVLDYSYVEPAAPTNITLEPKALPDKYDVKPLLSPDDKNYLAGFKTLKIGGVSIVGTPVFPGQTPHMITNRTFDESESNQIPGVDREKVPPNSFKAAGLSMSDDAKKHLGAASCAVIGAGSMVFPARFPKGYIRIVNKPGFKSGGWGDITINGSDDLFNRELFDPSSIVQSANGVFTVDKEQMQAWIAYNKSKGSDPFGHDGSLNPKNKGFDLSEMRIDAGPKQQATMKDLLAIKAIECECTHTMYNNSLGAPCGDKENVIKWASNYERASQTTQMSPTDDFIAAEFAKLKTLEERARVPNTYEAMVLLNQPTGLKLFDRKMQYTIPANPVNFSKPGTPWKLMTQIGDCACGASSKVWTKLYRRCQQIKPGVSPAEVIKALDAKTLPLGSQYYLYLDPDGKFTFDKKGPSWKTSIDPDGTPYKSCFAKYDIESISTNSRRSQGNSDAMFEDAPFSTCNQAAKGIDRIIWTDATGFENLLGVLEFENDLSGPMNFSAPN